MDKIVIFAKERDTKIGIMIIEKNNIWLKIKKFQIEIQ